MKLNVFVTLFVPTVLMLVSINIAVAATPPTGTSTTSIVTPDVAAPVSDFHASMNISRITSLNDFQDGSRNDSLNYEISPSLKTTFGTLISSITYSQNLRDQYSRTASDWGDIPVILAFKPVSPKWLGKNFKNTYSLSVVVPRSQISVKKDQLQTAVTGKISLSVTPAEGDGFGYSVGISLGRIVHAYEEDINGNVLNQYSSNQNLNLNYSSGAWGISAGFTNRTRLTYKNTVKSYFDMNEEVNYSINSGISITLGHTNSGSTLKANGTDSNIDLYNENNSSVYAALGLSY